MTGDDKQLPLFEMEAVDSDTVRSEPSAVSGPESPFSKYIVYVDESGDHSLQSIDQQYPLFVLAFCVFHKRH